MIENRAVGTLRRVRQKVVAGNGRRWKVPFSALLCALLLGACSTTRLAYDHLDLIARHEVGEFIDLDAAQQAQFDAVFDRLWLANRREALPKYAAALRELAATAEKPATVEELKHWNDRLDGFANALARDAGAAFAPLVGTLSDAQVADLLAHIDQRDAKRKRRAARRDASDERAHEQGDIETQLKKWTGDVSGEQHQLVVAWLQAKPPGETAQLDALDRGSRRALEALLAARHDTDFAARLQNFLTDPQFPERAAAEAYLDKERDRGLRLWVDLSRSFSPEQRSHLSAKLLAYADDFDALAIEKAD